MSTQLEIPAVIPRISTARGSMLVSSLRPGDWISVGVDVYFIVMINSARHRRIVLWSTHDHTEESYDWSNIGELDFFIGRGKPRRWLRWLPAKLRLHFCPYSRP